MPVATPVDRIVVLLPKDTALWSVMQLFRKYDCMAALDTMLCLKTVRLSHKVMFPLPSGNTNAIPRRHKAETR